MADRNARLSQNAAGSFYVDSECIGCKECVTLAGDIFDFDEAEDMAYVKRQPKNEEEQQLARQALEACPVNAIGDDG